MDIRIRGIKEYGRNGKRGERRSQREKHGFGKEEGELSAYPNKNPADGSTLSNCAASTHTAAARKTFSSSPL
jgi:hypothetical protein